MAYIPVTSKLIIKDNKYQLASILELYRNEDNFIDVLTEEEQNQGITENFKFADFQQNIGVATTLQLGAIASAENEYNSKVFIKDIIAYRIKNNSNQQSIVSKVYWGFGIRVIYKLYDFKADANLDAKAVGFAIEAGMVKADTTITGIGLKKQAFATVLKELQPPSILNNDKLTALLYKLFIGPPPGTSSTISNGSFTNDQRNEQSRNLESSVQSKPIGDINQQVSTRNYDLVPLGVELREESWELAQKSVYESIIKAMQFISNGDKYQTALTYARDNNYDKFSIEESYKKVVSAFATATTPNAKLDAKPSESERTKAGNWLNLSIHNL